MIKVVEIGRKNVKVVTEKEEYFFPSLVGEARELSLQNEVEDDLLDLRMNINGKDYFIGEIAEESYYRRMMRTEDKLNDETKVLFAACLKLIKFNPETDRLITLVPIKLHTNKEKERFADYLKGKYVVDGADYHVTKVDVLPEGVCSAWDSVLDEELQFLDRFDLDKFRVIEIGSRTVNYATFIKRGKRPMVFLDRESGTLPYGDLDSGNNADAFVRRIMNDLSLKWDTFNDLTLISGGGGYNYRSILKSSFPNHMFPSDFILSNARGALKVGKLKYGFSKEKY